MSEVAFVSEVECCSDAMPLLTLNVFRPRDTSDLISMVSLTFTTRRHLIRLASAPFASFRLAKFGWVPFADLCSVCNAWERRTRTHNLRRVGENSGPVVSCLWTKLHEILRQCRRPVVLSNALSRLSGSCFVQKIFAIKSRSRRKPNKCRSFVASSFLGGTTRLFYCKLLARFTVHRLAKFG